MPAKIVETGTTAAASQSYAVPRATVLRETGKVVTITFVALFLLAAFLSPLLRVTMTALKTPEQITATGWPISPAEPAKYTYTGEEFDIYRVPTETGVHEWALVKKGRTESQFVDPANPAAGQILWKGSWRTLDRAWQFAPAWDNFLQVWDKIQLPRLLFNTIALAVINTFATLLSCTLVAYGFARFRFPGKGVLFTLLIATIFLPAAVTLIPTYTVFVRLGWVGTWLPLIVPTFFANAFDVFLLRQFFLTIPREMDEAASIDGAGPLRILLSVILPQSLPVLLAVGIFSFVYAWNDFFGPLIYLSTRPDLQPISVGLSRFNSIYYTNPSLVQAGTIMTLAIPLAIFVVFQRYLIRGVVLTGTGVEK